MAPEHDVTARDADILVVDDEIASLRLLAELLTGAGYQVRAAERPLLALEAVRAQPPSLILLDVRMPEMSGFEVCRHLKQDERTRDIPIIFVSALNQVQDQIQGFEVGGVDFISKPFQELEVLARVRAQLQLRRMQAHLGELVAERTAELIQANKALKAEIAERKRAENELRKSEERFRATFEQAAVGIAHVAPDGGFLRINRRFCDIVGYSPEEMLAQTFQDITHPDDLDADLEHVRRLLAGGAESYSMEKRYVRKSGEIVWVNLTVALLWERTGEPRYFVSVVEDITPRKHAEQQILEYQQRLQALASQLTLTEERERHRIARELHDEVGQTLAYARMRLASARKATSDARRETILEDVSQSLRRAIGDTRDLVFDLSSPLMDEVGLAAALEEWLEEQVSKKHGIQTEFVHDGQRLPLDDDLRAILFRSVRELLTNVVKHAQAKRVSVRLEGEGPLVRIVVKDDGIGLDVDAILEAMERDAGFGLFSIQERMADLGGALEITSEPGQGCTATLTVPTTMD